MKRTKAICLAVALVACGVSATSLAQAVQDEKPVAFNINATTMSQALLQFTQQSRLQLAFTTTEPADLKAPKVIGELTPKAALDQLLKGSGLKYEFVNERTVSIRKDDTAVKPAGEPQASEGTGRSLVLAQGLPRGNEVEAGAEPAARDASARASSSVQPMVEVVVTGSHIRDELSAPANLIVIGRDRIEKSGYGDLGQLIASLPQAFGGDASPTVTPNMNRGFSAYNVGAGSSINLRGLGAGATLTLLNGNRMSPAGQGTFVDISMIPLSAIEQIQILTDGASAVYGSDAIGGVVNIITRSDYQGAETSARFGSVTSGDRREYSVSQLLGHSWEGMNLTVNFEHTHEDSLTIKDRPDLVADDASPYDLIPENTSNSLLSSFRARTGAGQLSADLLATDRKFSQRMVPATDPSHSEGHSRGLSGALSFETALAGTWSAEMVGSYSRNELNRTISGTQVPSDRDNGTYQSWSGEVRVRGDLANLPAGVVKVAAGLVYRGEQSSWKAALDNSFNYRATRDVSSVYGESHIPLLPARPNSGAPDLLDLSLAARFDHYSDFGDTTNPRVSLRLQPLKALSFRGTFSKSFRAPLFFQTIDSPFYRGAYIFDVPDPQSTRPDGMTSTLTYTGSNPAVGPEHARSFTGGFELRPELDGMSLAITANYFDIRYKDRIQDLSALDPTGFLLNGAAYGSAVTRNPSTTALQTILTPLTGVPNGINDFNVFQFGLTDVPAILAQYSFGALYDARLQNTAQSDLRGVDLSLNLSQDARFGTLRFGLDATYLIDYSTQVTSGTPSLTLVNTAFNPIDLRLSGFAGWSRAGWSTTLRVNHADRYNDAGGGYTVGGAVASWTTTDVQLGYDFGSRLQSNDLRVALNVLNLFDRAPPHLNALPGQFAFDAENASPVGRFVSLTLRKGW